MAVAVRKLGNFLRGDVVLSVALILACASCLIAPPNAGYFKYIDFYTLSLLFCLMLVVEGLREQRVFQYLGALVLSKVNTYRGIIATLVFLCFLSSMFITNDVALITFVPFAIMILKMAGLTANICLTITLMTLAGNLGSMFTPIGNPQNLYLYSISNLNLLEFLRLMAPYTLLSALLLGGAIYLAYRPAPIAIQPQNLKLRNGRLIIFYALLFGLCLLTVAGFLPYTLLLLLVSGAIFWRNRSLLTRIDYSLLLTFVFFFIFVGNLNHLDSLKSFIMELLSNHERLVCVWTSQIISNVPAAMLLANYTGDVRELIIGTNLGGLGTLIASMASLISYKQLITSYPQLKKSYLITFTIFNLLFLAALLAI